MRWFFVSVEMGQVLSSWHRCFARPFWPFVLWWNSFYCCETGLCYCETICGMMKPFLLWWNHCWLRTDIHDEQTCSYLWRFQPKIFGAAKIFDFRRATIFSLGYRLSKHIMNRSAETFWGHRAPWLRLWFGQAVLNLGKFTLGRKCHLPRGYIYWTRNCSPCKFL